MENPAINSILAADCGSANTSVFLMEPVNGDYRLVAQGHSVSTHIEPWHDLTVGLAHATRQIEAQQNRTILGPGGWPITPKSDEKGVDVFVVVCSAGEPLQVTLAGLMPDISLASAQRAATTTYTSIGTVVTLDSEGVSPAAKVQRLQQGKPDVILLVGGTEGGAKRPVLDTASLIAMAMQAAQGQQPQVLYTGNSHIREDVSAILGPVALLKMVDNLRPALDVENLAPTQIELENLYIQRKMVRTPGFDKLSNWTQYAVTPSSKSFGRVIAYLGQQNEANVMGINIGSGATMVATHAYGNQQVVVRSDAGIGHTAGSLIRTLPLARFQRWLPYEIAPGELYNQLLNRSLYPTTLPTNVNELILEQAIAREAIRLAIDHARQSWPVQMATNRHDVRWNMLVGSGKILSHSPDPVYAAMTLLDGAEPWGVTQLLLDTHGLTNVLGALAMVQPVAAVEVVARDTFLKLGTVIAPIGHGPATSIAVTVKITYPYYDDPVEIQVPYNSIRRLNLQPGQKASVEIKPGRNFDMGLGQPGRSIVTEVEGGVLGLIIDARGRPLRLPRNDEQRYDTLLQWLGDLDAPDASDDTEA